MLPINVEKQLAKGKVAQAGEQEPIDVLQLHSPTKKEEISFGHTGFIRQIWRIENFEKFPVPSDRWGHFYQGFFFYFYFFLIFLFFSYSN